MKKLAMALALLGSAHGWAASCVTSDVTIEGTNADACYGMYSGNVNSLADINTALGGAYTVYDQSDVAPSDITISGNSFSFPDIFGDLIAVATKQNTHWAVFTFDLSTRTIGANSVWDGTWSTSGMQWDNNPNVNGCQGCGGLSHLAIAGTEGGTEVPLPGTLGLLGLGLAGLGAVRRKQVA